MSKIYYDFDKGYIINKKTKLSKNLLNANYDSIIRKKNLIILINIYIVFIKPINTTKIYIIIHIYHII